MGVVGQRPNRNWPTTAMGKGLTFAFSSLMVGAGRGNGKRVASVLWPFHWPFGTERHPLKELIQTGMAMPLIHK